MENFSAIASLVLFGLFLITYPAEGFVTGYRYIDLSEPILHSSPIKRQGNLPNLDKQARIAAVMADDGKIIFGSKSYVEAPSRIILPHYIDDPKNGETIAGPGASEEQNQDQLNNDRQNNENDINAQNTPSNFNPTLKF